MSTYIDFDSLDEDVENLHEFMTEELGIETYKETILLLRRALKQIKPKEKEPEKKDLDYVG